MKKLLLYVGAVIVCAMSYAIDPLSASAQGIEFDIPSSLWRRRWRSLPQRQIYKSCTAVN